MLTVHRPCDTLFGSMPRYHVLRVDGPIPEGGLRAVIRLHGTTKEIGPIENGLATFTFTDEEVVVFPPGLAYGRLDITSPSGEVLSSMRFCAQVLITPPAPGPEVITADFGETLMPEGDFATKEDATLNECTVPGPWTASPAEITKDGEPVATGTPNFGDYDTPDGTAHGWYWMNPDAVPMSCGSDNPDATTLSVNWTDVGGEGVYDIVFTRAEKTAYRLGPDDPSNPNRDKLLAPFA